MIPNLSLPSYYQFFARNERIIFCFATKKFLKNSTTSYQNCFEKFLCKNFVGWKLNFFVFFTKFVSNCKTFSLNPCFRSNSNLPWKHESHRGLKESRICNFRQNRPPPPETTWCQTGFPQRIYINEITQKKFEITLALKGIILNDCFVVL